MTLKSVTSTHWVADPITLRESVMLVMYIILGFTAVAGIAIAKDDMSAL